MPALHIVYIFHQDKSSKKISSKKISWIGLGKTTEGFFKDSKGEQNEEIIAVSYCVVNEEIGYEGGHTIERKGTHLFLRIQKYVNDNGEWVK